MKLLTKTSIIIAGAWIAICLIVYADAKWVVSRNYQHLEDALVKNEIQDTQRAYDMTQSSLIRFATAWAVWDDAYEFMRHKSKKFIESNFVPGTFTSSKINFFLLYDKQGRFYHGGAYDFHKNKMIPASKSLLYYFEKHTDFIMHADINSKRSGVLRTPDGLIMMASLPIVTSDNKGPVMGTLLMGFYLDEHYFKNIAETIGSKTDFYNRSEILAKKNILNAYENIGAKNDDFTVEESKNLSYGYLLIKDYYKEAVGLIRVEIPRIIYNEGVATIKRYIMMVVVLGFAIILLTWYLFKLLVLNRILNVGEQVQAISRQQNFNKSIDSSGSDELTELVAHINMMINMIASSQNQLTYLATHDSLTKLPNRRLFYEFASEAILEEEQGGSRFAVLFIDLDGFKFINDQYGHVTGDKLLIDISNRLRICLMGGDIVARQSGDEFIALLKDIKSIQDVTNRILTILSSMDVVFSIDGIELEAKFSIGISLYPDDANTVEQLFHHADEAMYAAKNISGNGFCYYKDVKQLVTE